MENNMLMTYSEIEEIKKLAEKLGYIVGDIVYSTDNPYVKVSLNIMKKWSTLV